VDWVVVRFKINDQRHGVEFNPYFEGMFILTPYGDNESDYSILAEVSIPFHTSTDDLYKFVERYVNLKAFL
jgi:hypothetical protein